jgi:hypothetical protein
MIYAQYMHKVPSLKFWDFLVIKSISYKEKNILLKDSPRNRYMLFVVEKNRTSLVALSVEK